MSRTVDLTCDATGKAARCIPVRTGVNIPVPSAPPSLPAATASASTPSARHHQPSSSLGAGVADSVGQVGGGTTTSAGSSSSSSWRAGGGAIVSRSAPTRCRNSAPVSRDGTASGAARWQLGGLGRGRGWGTHAQSYQPVAELAEALSFLLVVVHQAMMDDALPGIYDDLVLIVYQQWKNTGGRTTMGHSRQASVTAKPREYQ